MLDKTIVRPRLRKPKPKPVNLTYYLGQGINKDHKPLGRQTHPLILRFLLGCVTGNYTDYLIIPTSNRTRLAVWLLDMYQRHPRQFTSLGFPRNQPLPKADFITRLKACEFLPTEVKDQWKTKLISIA